MHFNKTRRGFLKASLMAGPGMGLLARAIRGAETKLPFGVGVITDEITPKFEDALDFISHYSLNYCELRTLWRHNIMDATQDDLDKAKRLIEEHHLKVSDIGSPIMKYNLPEMPANPEKVDTFNAEFAEKNTDTLLHKSFELAHFFGTNKIRVFAYLRVKEPEKAYPYVRDRVAKAAEVAGKNKMILVLENEHSCNVGTGVELGRILRDINSPHLRGNWDPGNAVMLGETPYPDGYNAVRGLFAHMHVKDVRKDPQTGKKSWAPVGGGLIDYHGQFKALVADKYRGVISLETHYRRPDGNTTESTRESLEGLLKGLKEVG